VCGVVVTMVASGCFGSGSADKAQTGSRPRTSAGVPTWLVHFASREAGMLGDPSVRTALVAPITAAQAKLVFGSLRRDYPGHAYLLVLHGSFVSPRVPCPAGALGCTGYEPSLFRWQVMLASPTLGPAWRYFGPRPTADCTPRR
jgi:hypothetical protein